MSDDTGFAATHDVPEDSAYELLVSVGLATLDGHPVDGTLAFVPVFPRRDDRSDLVVTRVAPDEEVNST